MKICNKCDKEKPMDQFNADARRKDSKRSSCRECDAVQKKEIRQNNIVEYRRKNAEANRRYRKRLKDDLGSP